MGIQAARSSKGPALRAPRTGLTIDNTTFPEGQETALGQYVANEQAVTTLICWEHTAIPTIANAIVGPAQQSQIPQSWPDDRYDVIWAFTRPANTTDPYTFVQYPEMLLYGDSTSTIPVGSSSSSA